MGRGFRFSFTLVTLEALVESKTTWARATMQSMISQKESELKKDS